MQGRTKIKPEDVGVSSERLGRIDRWADGLIADGKLAGLVTLVARRGAVVQCRAYGQADVERGTKMSTETIFRIYSMTKPLTSVATMMLYEEGRFQLDDPITRFLPCFRNQRVWTGGSRGKLDTVPAKRDITFRDLLSHTSGLTYGFLESTSVDALYREKGVDMQLAKIGLGPMVELAASLPLLSQPGEEWNYSIATDVLGYLIEVIAGQPFETFLRERVLKPLGLVDTDFVVAEANRPRFAAMYGPKEGGGIKLLDDPTKSRYLAPRVLYSGGGGLTSTVSDYWRFCRFMLNKGELDGVRLLGRKTVELMTTNHLRGDMADMGQPRFSESTYEGVGFGLGFSVMLDPAKAQILGTPGEYAWGGAASMAFWVDPAEDMAVILMTQLMPSSTYPIRRELRVLTYQTLID